MTPREELEQLRQQQDGGKPPARPEQPTPTQVFPTHDPRAELERLRATQDKVEAIQEKSTASGIADDVKQGFVNAGKGATAGVMRLGANILPAVSGPLLFKKALEARQKAMDSAKEIDKDTGVGGFLGGAAADIAGTAGMGVPNAVAARGATMFPRAAEAVGRFGRAATTGAVQGAATSENPAVGAATGAVGGGVAQQVGARTAQRIADPLDFRNNAFAQIAQQRDLPLTVGQMANPHSFGGKVLRQVEESAAMYPLLGAAVQNRRDIGERAWRDDLAREVANAANVPPPANRRAPGTTFNDVLHQVGTDVGGRYDALLQGRTARPTGVLRRNLDNIINDPQLALTAEHRSGLRGRMEANVFDPVTNPPGGAPARNWDLPTLWKHQSTFRSEGNRILANRNATQQDRDYGRALVNSADEINAFIRRRHPQVGAQLDDLARPYAELSTLRMAADRGGPEGEFMPKHLARAAQVQGRRAQPAADEAALTYPQITKGSTKRDWLRNVAGLGLGLGTGPATTTAVTGMLGTETGQRFLTGRMNRQQQLQRLLDDPNFEQRLNQMLTTLGSNVTNQATTER
jgi:hypothetical protein